MILILNFQRSEGSDCLWAPGCTLHIKCVHTRLQTGASLHWNGWSDWNLGSKDTCSINLPFLRHLRPKMYWTKWNDATLSFLSVLSDVIAPWCPSVIKDLQGVVCLSFHAFSAHTHTKKAPTKSPHASDCCVTSESFLLKEQKDILKSFFNHFSCKETQRRISSSNLSIVLWTALGTEPLSPLTCCEQISRQLSARTEKKNILKSWRRLHQHDPQLISGMWLWDVEHPELISWAKLTGVLTWRSPEEGKADPSLLTLTPLCTQSSTAGQHVEQRLGASMVVAKVRQANCLLLPLKEAVRQGGRASPTLTHLL